VSMMDSRLQHTVIVSNWKGKAMFDRLMDVTQQLEREFQFQRAIDIHTWAMIFLHDVVFSSQAETPTEDYLWAEIAYSRVVTQRSRLIIETSVQSCHTYPYILSHPSKMGSLRKTVRSRIFPMLNYMEAMKSKLEKTLNQNTEEWKDLHAAKYKAWAELSRILAVIYGYTGQTTVADELFKEALSQQLPTDGITLVQQGYLYHAVRKDDQKAEHALIKAQKMILSQLGNIFVTNSSELSAGDEDSSDAAATDAPALSTESLTASNDEESADHIAIDDKALSKLKEFDDLRRALVHIQLLLAQIHEMKSGESKREMKAKRYYSRALAIEQALGDFPQVVDYLQKMVSKPYTAI